MNLTEAPRIVITGDDHNNGIIGAVARKNVIGPNAHPPLLNGPHGHVPMSIKSAGAANNMTDK